MKTSKISLRSETGKFVHLALSLSLLYFGVFHFFIFLFLILEIVFLWKRARGLFFLFLILGSFFCLRLFSLSQNLVISGEAFLAGTVSEVQEDRFYLCSNGKYLVFCDEANTIFPGDTVEIEGYFFEIESKQIPGGFDYDTYLLSSGIKGVFRTTSLKVTGHHFTLSCIPYDIENYVVSVLPKKAAAYVLLLVFGNDSLTDENLMKKWSELSVVHLFAISGMHVGLIAVFLEKMLRRTGIAKNSRNKLIMIFLLAFNLSTGFRVPIFRASFLYVAAFFQRKEPVVSSLDRLSLLFVGMLLYNPWYMESVGFQLSFLICFCLFLGRKIIGRKKGASLVKMTLMANICALPVTLSLNHGIGLLFLPANIVFIALVEFLMLPASFITLFFPFVSGAYVYLIEGFETVTYWFSEIDIRIRLGIGGEVSVVMFFLVLFLFCANLYNKRKRMTYLVLFAMTLIFISLPPTIATKVVVFDVGQGDAILIDSPGCRIVIDTGPEDDYDALIGYLLDQNIRHIDYLVITHNHDDHYGEVADILSFVEVGSVVMGSDPEFSLPCPVTVVEEGDIIGKNSVVLTVISAYTSDSDENNNSLVIYGSVGSDIWLFMADAGTEIESDIMGKYLLDPDIVKIGHHGSDTASSQKFVDSLSPSVCIVSVGKNSYNLPSETVLQRWIEAGALLYNTHIDGTIVFTYPYLSGRRFVFTYEKRRPWFCQMSSFFDLKTG